jgi:hypothetical protein
VLGSLKRKGAVPKRETANHGEQRVSDQTDGLLRIMIQVTARAAVPPEALKELVGKHRKAYNLCDGTRALSQVARLARVDKGNFSRTVQRWQALGIVFRTAPDDCLLYLYPLSEE